MTDNPVKVDVPKVKERLRKRGISVDYPDWIPDKIYDLFEQYLDRKESLEAHLRNYRSIERNAIGKKQELQFIIQKTFPKFAKEKFLSYDEKNREVKIYNVEDEKIKGKYDILSKYFESVESRNTLADEKPGFNAWREIQEFREDEFRQYEYKISAEIEKLRNIVNTRTRKEGYKYWTFVLFMFGVQSPNDYTKLKEYHELKDKIPILKRQYVDEKHIWASDEKFHKTSDDTKDIEVAGEYDKVGDFLPMRLIMKKNDPSKDIAITPNLEGKFNEMVYNRQPIFFRAFQALIKANKLLKKYTSKINDIKMVNHLKCILHYYAIKIERLYFPTIFDIQDNNQDSESFGEIHYRQVYPNVSLDVEQGNSLPITNLLKEMEKGLDVYPEHLHAINLFDMYARGFDNPSFKAKVLRLLDLRDDFVEFYKERYPLIEKIVKSHESVKKKFEKVEVDLPFRIKTDKSPIGIKHDGKETFSLIYSKFRFDISTKHEKIYQLYATKNLERKLTNFIKFVNENPEAFDEETEKSMNKSKEEAIKLNKETLDKIKLLKESTLVYKKTIEKEQKIEFVELTNEEGDLLLKLNTARLKKKIAEDFVESNISKPIPPFKEIFQVFKYHYSILKMVSNFERGTFFDKAIKDFTIDEEIAEFKIWFMDILEALFTALPNEFNVIRKITKENEEKALEMMAEETKLLKEAEESEEDPIEKIQKIKANGFSGTWKLLAVEIKNSIFSELQQYHDHLYFMKNFVTSGGEFVGFQKTGAANMFGLIHRLSGLSKTLKFGRITEEVPEYFLTEWTKINIETNQGQIYDEFIEAFEFWISKYKVDTKEIKYALGVFKDLPTLMNEIVEVKDAIKKFDNTMEIILGKPQKRDLQGYKEEEKELKRIRNTYMKFRRLFSFMDVAYEENEVTSARFFPIPVESKYGETVDVEKVRLIMESIDTSNEEKLLELGEYFNLAARLDDYVDSDTDEEDFFSSKRNFPDQIVSQEKDDDEFSVYSDGLSSDVFKQPTKDVGSVDILFKPPVNSDSSEKIVFEQSLIQDEVMVKPSKKKRNVVVKNKPVIGIPKKSDDVLDSEQVDDLIESSIVSKHMKVTTLIQKEAKKKKRVVTLDDLEDEQFDEDFDLFGNNTEDI